jgi:hypothetical protein
MKRTLQLEIRVAKAIQKQVGYFNGWRVSQASEDLACLRAARNVIRIVRSEYKNKSEGA